MSQEPKKKRIEENEERNNGEGNPIGLALMSQHCMQYMQTHTDTTCSLKPLLSINTNNAHEGAKS